MVLSCIVLKRKVNINFIFLSAGKCLTTRRRLTEIASLVYSTSLFYCLINQSEFAVASVRRGEQNGFIIAGVTGLNNVLRMFVTSLVYQVESDVKII